MRIPDHLPVFWETCIQDKKQQLELDVEQLSCSKLGKKYVKTVYCHPLYLNSVQSTSWEMLSWMKHKLESSLLGEISITSDMQMTHPYGRKWRGTKNPLDESERGERKSWPKAQHSENEEQCQALFFWAPKSLRMVIAAMKLKDAYSLEEKLWPT